VPQCSIALKQWLLWSYQPVVKVGPAVTPYGIAPRKR
jgi:hypothetical protein